MPALPQLRLLTSYVERWAGEMAELPRNAPLPRRLVEQAVSLSRDFVADPASVGTMIHGDLHYENVMAADREPWLAIDPKPMSGDPHYELAPMLWNRFDELAGDVRRAVSGAGSTPWSTMPGSTSTGPATGSSYGCSTTRPGASRTLRRCSG